MSKPKCVRVYRTHIDKKRMQAGFDNDYAPMCEILFSREYLKP